MSLKPAHVKAGPAFEGDAAADAAAAAARARCPEALHCFRTSAKLRVFARVA